MTLHNISNLPFPAPFKSLADAEEYCKHLRRAIMGWVATLPEHVNIVTMGLTALADPNDDRIVFWDDSAGNLAWLDLGNSLAITTTSIDTIQDIRTTAGPSFDHLHLTVAIGTAPLSITSTTMSPNLNADLLDGYHASAFLGLPALTDPDDDRIVFWDDSEGALKWLDLGNSLATTLAVLDTIQDIRTTAGPSFDHLHLTVATGTAPLAITSTTVCTNLNADMTDGQHLGATDGPTFDHLHITNEINVGTYGYFGANDVTRGIVYAYGPATGGNFGGAFLAYTGADYDTVVGNYGFMIFEDDLYIGPDTNVDALKLDPNDDLYITGGSLVLPASEYVNFGGTQGSGGYGLRDNAGDVEYCDSGGAWTALNAGGGGAGDSMVKAVAQATHGLSVGNAVKCTGANTYAKAQADSEANAEVVGIVASSSGVDDFVLLMGGYWASASVPAQAAGTVMYLSPTSAGAMTVTEPTTDGQISKPLGVIVENGAKMLIFNWRGVELATLAVTGADLGTTFGATATNLHNTIITTFTNRAYAFQNLATCASAAAMFTGLINAGGTGGLTATNVPYDGDSNEAMLVPFPTLTLDARIVLHNTTRGTARLVTAIDTANNFITTVSTADAWADNDALTMESQTCTGGSSRFCDLDLSGMIPATATAVYLEVNVLDSAGGGGLFRLHPYGAFSASKIQHTYGQVANISNMSHCWVPVTSQRVCIDWGASAAGTTLTLQLRCFGWIENADT